MVRLYRRRKCCQNGRCSSCGARLRRAAGALTLPFIYALSEGDKSDVELIRTSFNPDRQLDQNALTRIRDMLQGYGAIDYGLRKAKDYASACKDDLESLKSSESQESLAMLADYVVARVS